MSGFDNEVLYARNVDFTGNASVTAQMTQDGQLLIGASSAPFIRAANLSSGDGTITIANGPGTIDIRGASTVTISAGPGIGVTSVGSAYTVSQTSNIKSPGAYPYTTLSTDYVILVDTSLARTITPLGSPSTGQTYRIKDSVGSAATNNITITPSGKNIDGAASYVINVNYGSIDIVYNGTEWSVL